MLGRVEIGEINEEECVGRNEGEFKGWLAMGLVKGVFRVIFGV